MSFKDKLLNILFNFLFAVIVLAVISLMFATPFILSRREDKKTYELIRENPEEVRKFIEMADSLVFKKSD